MTITTTRLTKAAGISAAAAGAIFIGVQINHPPARRRAPRHHRVAGPRRAKVLMAVLALVGITGMYLRQVRQHRRPRARRLPGVRPPATSLCSPSSASPPTSCRPWPTPTRATSRTSSRRRRRHARAATSATCRPVHRQPASATRSAACSSASPCSAPASWPAGRPLLLAVGTTSALALAVLPESFDRPFAVPDRRRADRPRRLAVARPAEPPTAPSRPALAAPSAPRRPAVR